MLIHVQEERAGIPSINRLIARVIALEAWKAFSSTDGPGRERNPIGCYIFGPRKEDGTHSGRSTRSKAVGTITPTLMAAPCMTYSAYRVR